MRLLMVNKLYPPDIGGVETVVAQYARAARAAGHSVHVLTCHSRPGRATCTTDEAEGVRVTRCRSLGTLWSLPISPTFLVRFLLLKRHFDLIHFHEPFPLGTLAALMSARDSYVITWHSDIVRQRIAGPLSRFLQRLACRRAGLITTTSKPLAEESRVLASFPGKIRVIPLSVDASMGASLPRPISAPYCLYLGRLASYKGLDTLLTALSRVQFRSAKLVIAGDGPLRSWLAAELAGHHEEVVLIDRHVSEAEKQALLQHCLFLVFPSSQRNEAFGIVQLEAMAHGKPVINTSLPTGVPWVSLHGDTGLTVPPNDAPALAHAIQTLLDDPSARSRLGVGARQRVHTFFSDETVLGQLLATYEEAALTRPR